jgi:hypothetical protein
LAPCEGSVTWCGGVVNLAGGDAALGRKKGGDDVSWVDANLYGLNLSSYIGILTLHLKLKKNIIDNMKH